MKMRNQVFIVLSISIGMLGISCYPKSDRYKIKNCDSIGSIVADLYIPPIDSLLFDYNKQLQDIRYVFLEENKESKVRHIDKMLFDSNRIFVFDKKITQSLFIYDGEGKFIKKISPETSYGKNAPGIPSSIYDISVNFNNKEIAAYDYKNRQIHYYDQSGKFLRKHKQRFSFYQFSSVRGETETIYWDLCDAGQIKELKNMGLFFKNERDSFFTAKYIGDKIDLKSKYFVVTSLSSLNSSEVFFTPPFSDSIYLINVKERAISPRFRLHFPGPTLSSIIKDPNEVTVEQINNYINTGEYYGFNGVILSNDKSQYYIQTTKGNLHSGYFYSQKTNKMMGGILSSHLQFGDSTQFEGFSYPIATTDKNEFVSILTVAKTKNNGNLRIRNLESIIQQNMNNNNPLLAIYKVKEF